MGKGYGTINPVPPPARGNRIDAVFIKYDCRLHSILEKGAGGWLS